LWAVMGNGVDRPERTYFCSGSCAAGSCCLEKNEAVKEMNLILGTDKRYELRRSRSDTCLDKEAGATQSDDEHSEPCNERLMREQTGDRVFREQTGLSMATEPREDSSVPRERTDQSQGFVPLVRVSQGGASVSTAPWPPGAMSPHGPHDALGARLASVASLHGAVPQHQQAAMPQNSVNCTSSPTLAVAPRMRSSPCWSVPHSPRLVRMQGRSSSACGASKETEQSRPRPLSRGRSSVSSLHSCDASTVATSASMTLPALIPCTSPCVSAPLPQQQQRQQQQQQQQQQIDLPQQLSPQLPPTLQHEESKFDYHTPPPPLSSSLLAAAAAAAAAGRLAMTKRSAITPGDMGDMSPPVPKVRSEAPTPSVPIGGVRNIRNSAQTPKGSRAGSATNPRFSSIIATARSLGLSSVCSARDQEANMPLFYVTD